MNTDFKLVKPKFLPPLDASFRPAALVNQTFQQEIEISGEGIPLIFALERPDGTISRYETQILPPKHPRATENLRYAERIFKFLLWQRGGCTAYIGGPKQIGQYLQASYAANGTRAFDHHFIGEEIYGQPFTVLACAPSEVPIAQEKGKALGRHLDGYRIGFDLGASDRKVSAVVNGKAIYSEEIVWEPSKHSDPTYHYQEVMTALKTAASKMPRVDAIGGSSAGVYVNNRVQVASLFRNIPKEKYDKVRNMFLRIRDELKVPLEIVNDGDVTALAGSMSLNANGVLGIALGSSEASGYVNMKGNITGWLNELAFAPVDYNPDAPVEEWSGDRGVGAQYFSQQCVFRLAPKVGIQLPNDVTDAEKLKAVQKKLEAGDRGATQIWQSIGIYMGYTLAHYADFYPLNHVLILGRCTSGIGGQIILDEAKKVLGTEFPALAESINIQLPDEKSRRVGQSIAAASLPMIA